jgi:trehalose-phosphatase
VALVSGRGVEDLRTVSGFTGPYRWVGSHGAEYGGPLTGELAGRRDALADRLAPLVAAVPGALLEVKPASVAVHVRQVADPSAAAALLAAADGMADASLTKKPGKAVLELAVTDADKGGAVTRLREELGAAAVVYLGDDLTDEDVFGRLGPDDVGVKVGEGDTAAGHRVADPTRRSPSCGCSATCWPEARRPYGASRRVPGSPSGARTATCPSGVDTSTRAPLHLRGRGAGGPVRGSRRRRADAGAAVTGGHATIRPPRFRGAGHRAVADAPFLLRTRESGSRCAPASWRPP